MSIIVTSLLLPIIAGIVCLVIEYWIIPRFGNRTKSPSMHPPRIESRPSSAVGRPPTTGPATGEVYLYLLLALLGASAGLSAAMILKVTSENYYSPNSTSLLNTVAETLAYSDAGFLITAIIMVICAAAVALLLDANTGIRYSSAVVRFVTALIMGFLAAWVSCIVVPVVLVILVLWLDTTSTARSGSKKD
jgi:hypothetical protein